MTLLPVLEVGGTHVSAARVDTATWSVVRGSIVTRPLEAAGTARAIVDTLVSTALAVDPRPSQMWGVALPGPFDFATGVAWYSGVGKFDALHGVDLGRALRGALRTDAVRFVSDAEAFAIGEWSAGAAIGAGRVLGVTLGTGVGSAWLVDGVAVLDGPGVAPQGRVDLLEVDGRPLEDWVSRRAILARYATLAGSRAQGLDVVHVAERARTGEPAAAAAIGDALALLGSVLAPRAVSFDADVVVVGGSIAQSWDLVGPALAIALTPPQVGRSHSRPRLVPAQLGADAALVGTARRALTLA